MYQGILCAFCVLIAVQSTLSLSKKPCKEDDAVCIIRMTNEILDIAVNGDSKLNMKCLEPMIQEYIEGKFSVINYHVHNTTTVGIKDCHIVQAKLSMMNNSMSFKLICPYLYMYGVYEVSGKLLIVPIEGRGDYRIDSKDYHIYIDAKTKLLRTKDGEIHFNFKNFKVNGDLRGGMVVDLKNLFNGQHKELADAALKVANEQWKLISQELQGPIVDIHVKKIIENMNKYLKTVPLDQLIIY